MLYEVITLLAKPRANRTLSLRTHEHAGVTERPVQGLLVISARSGRGVFLLFRQITNHQSRGLHVFHPPFPGRKRRTGHPCLAGGGRAGGLLELSGHPRLHEAVPEYRRCRAEDGSGGNPSDHWRRARTRASILKSATRPAAPAGGEISYNFV